MIQERKEFIDTVDLNQLRTGIRSMFMRPFAPRLAQELELGRYLRELLRTRRWSVVRVQPHLNELGVPSSHIVDVYDVPARADHER
jgi:hypothetical protein